MNNQIAHEKIQRLANGKGCTIEKARRIEAQNGASLNIKPDHNNGGFTYNGYDDFGNSRVCYVPA